MTNGEKLKAVLNPRANQIRILGNWVEIEIQKLGINFSCGLDWWNAEYKEPSTKINQDLTKNRSEIPTGSITENCIACKYDEIEESDGSHCKKCLAGDSQFELDKEFVQTTKNNLVVDCISRADAIKAMQEKAKKLTNEDTINGLCGAVAVLFDLPPVTPQEPRWIPTSERLPDEDGEYYATVYDTDENYKYMDIAEFEDGIWQYKDYVKVLAWMPLPKPYKPQESKET